MKAVVINPVTWKLEITELNIPEPKAKEVIVKITYASINHHELWTLLEKNCTLRESHVFGSDGVGIVSAVGTGVDKDWLDKRVTINPSLNWGNNEKVQGENYEILGDERQGTFAEYIAIPVRNIVETPAYLSDQEAAAVPLAGLTAFRGLFTRGGLCIEDNVLITGIGGGVAIMALLFCDALGAKAYVTSSSGEKMEKALEYGSLGGGNYTHEKWMNALKLHSGKFDLIFDSAGGPDFGRYLELLNPAGRLVNCGRTAGAADSLNTKELFWKQLSILGTTMGSER
ncbi:MAG: medium chain dehydrogenase/reductase family protein, partial [Cyclobacteriaceae bacterium]|nr:medium chain dehydrogenase/reductase family protein [Cyclobacteriaceae bacterium]